MKIVKNLEDCTVIEKIETATFVVQTNYDDIPYTWFKGEWFLSMKNGKIRGINLQMISPSPDQMTKS